MTPITQTRSTRRAGVSLASTKFYNNELFVQSRILSSCGFDGLPLQNETVRFCSSLKMLRRWPWRVPVWHPRYQGR